jgi:hypothetical protein
MRQRRQCREQIRRGNADSSVNQDENAGLVDRREGVARPENRQPRVCPNLGGSYGRGRFG